MSETKWGRAPVKTTTDGGETLWMLTAGLQSVYFPRESTAIRVFNGEIDYETGWAEDRKWITSMRACAPDMYAMLERMRKGHYNAIEIDALLARARGEVEK